MRVCDATRLFGLHVMGAICLCCWGSRIHEHVRPGPTPSIPQEVIDNIIDELRGDNTTLKQCTMVSRSFHLPCRRNIFCIVKLDADIKIIRLHHLLASTPRIAGDIRELEVSVIYLV